jgi:hypothetical protein
MLFFDLEKAYDPTWKYGILKDLFDMGLKGKLPNFISNFLSEREFNVILGRKVSLLLKRRSTNLVSVTILIGELTPGLDRVLLYYKKSILHCPFFYLI